MPWTPPTGPFDDPAAMPVNARGAAVAPWVTTPTGRIHETRLVMHQDALSPNATAILRARPIVVMRPSAIYVPPTFRKGNLVIVDIRTAREILFLQEEPKAIPLRALQWAKGCGYVFNVDWPTLQPAMGPLEIHVQNRGKYARPAHVEVVCEWVDSVAIAMGEAGRASGV